MKILNKKFDCIGKSELRIIAKELSAKIKQGYIIELIGGLGTGKTFFVKCICEYFKIKNVSSPSFNIFNQYNGKLNVFHFDFYRIKNKEELFNTGFYEHLSDDDAVKFIEWPNLIPEAIPVVNYRIYLDYCKEHKLKRNINIVCPE
ncbi:MAG: tRNA (adenosine(37)-N6)-threonylcarbamoyltransferase complex ATPase subunit type 1 TsaE [Ignavibacteriales bacterium]|nr:tRNA (adenosine(37)-N6)-threonylcarbamoyltransferase complex ATPase subunit type 1 TsaE [Ignavibacteriales bacterium]